MDHRAQKSWPALAAAALAVVLYAVNLGGTYIYDDVQIIHLDTRIHSVSQWKEIWKTDYFNGAIDNLYRPLTTMSYAIQWWINGDRPWAFHLVNILLHAGVAAAVAELARRLAGMKTAFAAGLLFAALPIHVEAVAGIVGRAEELCTLFILIAMILFLHRPLTTGRACAIGLCGACAMLTKEQGMLLPFLLLALAILTRYRTQSEREYNVALLLSLWLCLSVAGLIVLREQVLNLKFEWDKGFLDVSIQPMIRSGPMDRLLMVFVILGHYAQLTVLPLKLSIDYGLSVLTSVADRSDPYLYIGFATAAGGMFALIYALVRGQRAAAFCLIAAGLTYGMASNVILIGTIFGERLMYLPSAFLLIWIAMMLAKLRPPAFAAVLAIILSLASLRTVTYAARWNDRYQFYKTSLAEQPRSVRLCELVATECLARGDLAGAERAAAQGCRAAPDYWNIWVLAGAIAERQGDLKTAEAMDKKAFDLQPSAATHQALAQVEHKLQASQRQ
ncbi:MAG TPA: glycosyltransferase family 39 protein [Tepidisphaeraceae bacterium]|nr:glycosyltransferase family 39 protein [Tepidisphaeraceae bacterium]